MCQYHPSRCFRYCEQPILFCSACRPAKWGHFTQMRREPCQKYRCVGTNISLLHTTIILTTSFSEPIANVTGAFIIDAFDNAFVDLTEKRFEPKFNVIDNQATGTLKAYMVQHDCKWKFVEPSNHRVNAAERAIQTFKNHVISGLCTTDTN